MRPSPPILFHVRYVGSKHNVVQTPIEAAYYRGGTSRAVIIQPRFLPKERAKWPSIFRQILGNGDIYKRQLDGMGAGISSPSKICLVEPYGKRIVKAKGGIRILMGFSSLDAVRANAKRIQAREGALQSGNEQDIDIDYTFVGLGGENDEVDVAGDCGNMISAIGPYAYNIGLLEPKIYAKGDGEVTVKIRNTNTGKLIDTTLEVVGGQAAVVGDYSIDGVTERGPKIKVDFKHPYGSKTGKLFPTGKKVDNIAGYRVSCVDGEIPIVFVRADEVGIDGTILPNNFNKLPDKLSLLELIRKAAAVVMGIAPTEAQVPRAIPQIGLVSQSSTHPILSGQVLKTPQIDIIVRFLSDTQLHRAIPLTAALTTAVAASIHGTIVEQMLAPDPVTDKAITIGHASGRIQVNATMDKNNRVPVRATVYTTAKRLFEGYTFWTDNDQSGERMNTSYGSKGEYSLGLRFVLENRGQSNSHLLTEETLEEEQNICGKEVPENLERKQEDEQQSGPFSSNSKKGPDIHTATPLATALQKLRNHLTYLLEDPNMASRPYSANLQRSIENSYRGIVINSRPRKKTVKDDQRNFSDKAANRHHKSSRMSGKNRRALEKNGLMRTRRKEVGINKDGSPGWI